MVRRIIGPKRTYEAREPTHQRRKGGHRPLHELRIDKKKAEDKSQSAGNAVMLKGCQKLRVLNAQSRVFQKFDVLLWN